MESKHFRAAELISLFVKDQITASELQELKRMMVDFPELEDWVKERGVKMVQVQERLGYYQQLDTQVEWEHVLNKAEESNVKSILPKKWLAVAASVILVASVGGLIFKYGPSKQSRGRALPEQVKVSPGTNMAILTLSDGSQVLLEEHTSKTIADGNISLQIHNNQIDYTASDVDEVSVHKLEVPRGGTYHIQLADGTKVWLNADSELEFPSAFPGNERNVTVKGEAYFEVAKDATRPFKVHVEGTEVEALGTAFNINTHLHGQKVKTILTEGRVKVSEGGNNKIINAGYETISGQGDIQIRIADMEEALSWRDGYFYFNSKDLADILGEVARWYKVDIDMQIQPSKERYVGGIKRSESIAAVCKTLSDLTAYRFVIEHNKLIVKYGKL